MLSERKILLNVILLSCFIFLSLRLNPYSFTELKKVESYELNYTFCKEETKTHKKVVKQFLKNKKGRKTNFAIGSEITRTKDEFVIFAMRTAIQVEKQYGTNAIVQCAQLIIESYYGQSTLARLANNLTGIKCYSNNTSKYWKGEYVKMDDDRPKEKFKKYSNFKNSIFDYGLHLTMNPRYRKCLNQKDYKKVIKEIKAAGYATSNKYCKDLHTAIRDNNLVTLYNKIVNENANSNSVVDIPDNTLQ